MVGEIRIYFEGDDALREGFRVFFRELDELLGCPVRPIAGRGRDQAIVDFQIAIRKHPNALNCLLIDSDGPDEGKLFESICQPKGIVPQFRETVFWMVQSMESWFLADTEALSNYYGKDIRAGAAGQSECGRDTTARCLRQAKGRYEGHNERPLPQNKTRATSPEVDSAGACDEGGATLPPPL
jgi:hypothetical protein